MQSLRWITGAPLALACACSPASTSPAGNVTEPVPDAGVDAPAIGATDVSAADGGMVVVPLAIKPYPGSGNGKFLLLAVRVNDSPPIDVLFDTGSVGLRVFASALGGTKVVQTKEMSSVEFGGGDTMVGPTALATVSFGGVATPAPIGLQVVTSFTCDPQVPDCDFASGSGEYYTSAGIYGIFGAGLRPGEPADIYSPVAQLGGPYADAFAVATGGFSSGTATLTLGQSEEEGAEGGAPMALPREGTLPNGAPAWGDDQATACFRVDGSPTSPACTSIVFDTGSNSDVLYAPSLPLADEAGGMILAPGIVFEATHAGAFDTIFKVGADPTASVDLVYVSTQDDFSILGIDMFFRNDVRFDLAHGTLSLAAAR